MGVQENDDKPINLLDVQPEITEEEPIEKVFSKEPEDVRTAEPSTESEDRDRFEETAKFEEEIDTPKVDQKPQRVKVRKSKVTKKTPAKEVYKSVSQLHDELRNHSDARRKTELAIIDIRKELKDLLLTHHATIKELQKQVAQMHRKIASIDRCKKFTKTKTTRKKTSGKKRSTANKKPKKTTSTRRNNRKS